MHHIIENKRSILILICLFCFVLAKTSKEIAISSDELFAPSISDFNLIAITSDGSVNSIDIDDGSVKWSTSIGSSLVAINHHNGGDSLIANVKGELFQWDVEQQTAHMFPHTIQHLARSSLIRDGHDLAFVGEQSSNLLLLDLEDGTIPHHHSVGLQQCSSERMMEDRISHGPNTWLMQKSYKVRAFSLLMSGKDIWNVTLSDIGIAHPPDHLTRNLAGHLSFATGINGYLFRVPPDCTSLDISPIMWKAALPGSVASLFLVSANGKAAQQLRVNFAIPVQIFDSDDDKSYLASFDKPMAYIDEEEMLLYSLDSSSVQFISPLNGVEGEEGFWNSFFLDFSVRGEIVDVILPHKPSAPQIGDAWAHAEDVMGLVHYQPVDPPAISPILIEHSWRHFAINFVVGFFVGGAAIVGIVIYFFSAHKKDTVETTIGNCVKVGPLQIFLEKELGKGSHGTTVFEGRLNGKRTVAVKRMLRSLDEFAQKEIDLLLRADDHPNVVRYFVAESTATFMYLALECCDCTLDSVLRKIRESSATFQPPCDDDRRFLAELVDGVGYLHSRRIVHRDLKPRNILLKKNKESSEVNKKFHGWSPKISDMGLGKQLSEQHSSFAASYVGGSGRQPGSIGWQAPEAINPKLNLRSSRATDIFSLGCIIYSTIDCYKHPFGEVNRRDFNIQDGRINLSRIANFPEAFSLIEAMTQHDPSLRPSIQMVSRHPFFWRDQKQIQFLCHFSDFLEKLPRSSPIVSAFERLAQLVFRQCPELDWRRNIDGILIEDMFQFRNYSDSLLDCLRLIRNKHNHYSELSPEACRILGPPPSSFLNYFTQKFPGIVLHCWKFAERHQISFLRPSRQWNASSKEWANLPPPPNEPSWKLPKSNYRSSLCGNEKAFNKMCDFGSKCYFAHHPVEQRLVLPENLISVRPQRSSHHRRV